MAVNGKSVIIAFMAPHEEPILDLFGGIFNSYICRLWLSDLQVSGSLYAEEWRPISVVLGKASKDFMLQ